MKAKLAEKEAAKAARRAEGEDSDLDYDSDDVIDPREKARRDKERELNSDLANAAALLGSAALGGISHAYPTIRWWLISISYQAHPHPN